MNKNFKKAFTTHLGLFGIIFFTLVILFGKFEFGGSSNTYESFRGYGMPLPFYFSKTSDALYNLSLQGKFNLIGGLYNILSAFLYSFAIYNLIVAFNWKKKTSKGYKFSTVISFFSILFLFNPLLDFFNHIDNVYAAFRSFSATPILGLLANISLIFVMFKTFKSEMQNEALKSRKAIFTLLIIWGVLSLINSLVTFDLIPFPQSSLLLTYTFKTLFALSLTAVITLLYKLGYLESCYKRARDTVEFEI